MENSNATSNPWWVVDSKAFSSCGGEKLGLYASPLLEQQGMDGAGTSPGSVSQGRTEEQGGNNQVQGQCSSLLCGKQET